MSSLYKWFVSFLSDYIPCWISSLALSDLQWWSSLHLRTHSPCFLTPARPTHDYNIWVDASTEWGISLLCGSHQAMWCLLDGWKGPSRNIGWLEGVTVELAILALKVMGIHNVNMLIWSDNKRVIRVFSEGQCSNFMTNLSICHSDEVCHKAGISTTLIYVNTVDNLADPIFCGCLPQPQNSFPNSFPSPPSSPLTSLMSQSNWLLGFLKGINVSVQAAAFYLNASPLDIHHVASLPPSSHVHLPHMCKDMHIIPSLCHPNVLASKQVLCWTTPHSNVFQFSLNSQPSPLAILKLFQAMLFSLDKNTHSNYSTGLLCFIQDRKSVV